MNQFLNIDFLKKNHTHIHGFGLGFIQIKLNLQERVHFYTSQIKLTTQPEEIHNHRYDFTSYVLQGEITNFLYEVPPNEKGGYVLVNESCNPSSPKTPLTQIVGTPRLISEFTTLAGQSYFLNQDIFHTISAKEGTITYLNRGTVTKATAQIVYPREQINTCPFSSNLPPRQLWDLVNSLIKLGNL